MIDRRRFCLTLLAGFSALATRGSAGAISKRDGEALSRASLIYVATVRKDGNQSKAAPVWFIATPDGRILIDTGPNTWKAKRIRRGSPVLVWIGSATGPAFIGKAEFVTERTVQDRMIEEIPKKYWIARVGLFAPKRAKFDSGEVVTIRITPQRDLPDGFRSEPGTPAPRLAGNENVSPR